MYSDGRVEYGTLLLVTLSAAILTAARSESHSSLAWLLGATALFVIGPWILWIAQRHRPKLAERSGRWLPVACSVWTLLPVALTPVLRGLDVGDATEIVVLVCVQNVALVAAAFSHRRRCQHFACLLSAFLALFAMVMGSSTVVFVLAGLFGVLMLWWLMTRYWERVQRTVCARWSERRLPLRSSVLVAVAFVSLLMLAALNTKRLSTYSLRGLMPSSGGDQWSDPFARAGVGDGDAMVAAQENAMSFGPVESELFLDSDMPSLYDMFDDTYGEPIKKQRTELSIGLAPSNNKREQQRTATSKQSGREFSTLRRKVTPDSRALDDREAAAMLYVVGRVPLHLALERFDTFDGQTWSSSGGRDNLPPIRLEKHNDKPWAYCQRVGGSRIHRGLQFHAIKIINVNTNRFPSPPQLTAVHVDKVDRLDFFGWTDDGVFHMPARESIPQLTVLHVKSQGVNLQSLRTFDFTENFPKSESLKRGDARTAIDVTTDTIARHLAVSGDRHLLAQLASAWTRDVPRGWRQVEAVTQQIRRHFTHDPNSSVPAECDDAVRHFIRTQRGPSYVFATTLAMVLRELGYPTRLVTGFYADPDRFNRRSGQTIVLAEDVHAWVEVNVDGRTWVAIEPTPGYQAPWEHLSWGEWAKAAAASAVVWCWRNAAMLLVAIAFALMLIPSRRHWLDCAGQGICRLCGVRSLEARLRWTIRLLEWRAWLAGCQRPSQRTIVSWYSSLLGSVDAELKPSLREFFVWTDRVLYDAADIDPASHREISHACSAAMRASRLHILRASAKGAFVDTP